MLALGIVGGNPGVFQGYPCLYPEKPIPVTRVRFTQVFGQVFHQQNDTSLTRLISLLKFDCSVTKLSAMLSDH